MPLLSRRTISPKGNSGMAPSLQAKFDCKQKIFSKGSYWEPMGNDGTACKELGPVQPEFEGRSWPVPAPFSCLLRCEAPDSGKAVCNHLLVGQKMQQRIICPVLVSLPNKAPAKRKRRLCELSVTGKTQEKGMKAPTAFLELTHNGVTSKVCTGKHKSAHKTCYKINI